LSFSARIRFASFGSACVPHPAGSGGCTALFDGWRAGATEVAEHLDPVAMNRVLLLFDGQANEGHARRGISTSAFGLGDDFDEDLMGAMASWPISTPPSSRGWRASSTATTSTELPLKK